MDFEEMTHKQRLEFMAGGRVTVKEQFSIDDDGVNNFFVTRIRGRVISSDGSWKHHSAEAAKAAGKKTLEKWKSELAA